MSKSREAIRVANIGCGGMGYVHTMHSKQDMPHVQVVAFVDPVQEKREKLLKEFGGEYATADLDRVFHDDSIDAVLINTPPSTHCQLGIAAAKAGRHIFMEKPIGTNLREIRALEDAVKEAGVKFMIGFCNRLAPLVLKAKEMIPHPQVSFCQCADTIVHQACHNIDLIVNLFHESKLEWLSAIGAKHRRKPAPDMEDYAIDSFSANFHFADGSISTYLQHGVGRNDDLMKYHFQLFHEDRSVYLAKRFTELRLYSELPLKGIAYDVNPSTRGRFGYMGHWEELAAFGRSILDNTPCSLTLEEAKYVFALEEAIVESATANAKRIEIADFFKKHNV